MQISKDIVISLDDMSIEDKTVSLTYLLSRFVQYAYCDDRKKTSAILPDIVALLTSLLPRILDIYSTPEMHECADDRDCWVAQLRRINEAIESDDIYRQADVLYFETYINLIEFLSYIEEKGIAL